jgi:Na+/H+-dicarboxylate symporter
MSLLIKISIGFAAGIVFGFAVGPFADENVFLGGYAMPFLNIIGRVFITLLKMIIVPLVISSIIVGTSSLGDPRKLGRIGIKTLGLYIITTAVAIAIGLLLGNIIQPGIGMNIEGVTAEAKASKPLVEVFLDIFPSNPIESLVKANMLQIIVFAVFFGTAAVLAGEKGKRVLDVFDSIAETMYAMTHMIMSFAPYGVFSLIAITAAKYGPSILAPFAKVILAVFLGCVIHAALVYSGLIAFFCRRSPLWYFRGIQEASITAFVTRSSSGTLPVTIENTRKNLGVSDGVSSFVLPLGATINMDGTALYQGVCALFVAQAYGIDLNFGAQIGVIVTATLASIGTAGVPGAGLIMLTLVLTSAGLPIEGGALVAGIDAILDAARTCLNVTGDAAVCAVVAATEGEALSASDNPAE